MRKLHPLALGVLVAAFCAVTWVWADPPLPSYPTWWTSSPYNIVNGSIPSASDTTAYNAWMQQNYAPATVGQLKNVATQAQAYLNSVLAYNGGAGSVINSTVANFTTSDPNNAAVVNLGQLKNIAQPFYDRLIASGVNTQSEINYFLSGNANSTAWAFNYPWNPSTPVNQNYAAATLGQLKFVFDWDLTRAFLVQNPNNNTPYGFYTWASQFSGLSLNDTNLPNEDPMNDGTSNWLKYQADENPLEYIYSSGNATHLTLTVSNGGQTGTANTTLPDTVKVVVAVNGTALANAAIDYEVLPGGSGSGLALNITSNTTTIANGTSGNLFSDANGTISMNYTLGTSPVQWIHFTAPTTNVSADAVFTLTNNGSSSSGGNSSPVPGIGTNGTSALITPTVDSSSSEDAPYNLAVQPTSATPIDYTNVTLTWDAGSDDSGVTFNLQQKLEANGTWSNISSIPNSGNHTATSNSLSVGKRYLFQIVAVKAGAVVGTSNTASYLVPFLLQLNTTGICGGDPYPVMLHGQLPQYEGFEGDNYYRTYTNSINYTVAGNYSSSTTDNTTVTLTANTNGTVGNLTWDIASASGNNSTTTYDATGEDGPGNVTTGQTIYITSYLNATSVTSNTDNYAISYIPVYPPDSDTPDSWSSISTWSNSTNSMPLADLVAGYYGAESGGYFGTASNDTTLNVSINNTSAGTVTLSHPYAMGDLITDMNALTIPYPALSYSVNLLPEDFSGDSPFHLGLYGVEQYALSPVGIDVLCDEYQFAYVPPDTNMTINWTLEFLPDSGNATSIAMNCTANSTGKSPIYEANPENTTLNPGSVSGNVYLILNPNPTIIDQYGPVDQTEANGTIQIIGNNFSAGIIPNGDVGAGNTDDAPGNETAVVSWTGADASALTFVDDEGDIIGNGVALDDTTFDDGAIYAYAPDAVAGQTFNVTVSYYGPGNVSLGNRTVNLEKAISDNELTVSNDEITGAEYRKIALDGRPLPDGKPQTASESDQQDEETFVDALTLGLRHSVTDVYEPVPGSSLPLTVNRVYQEEIWSNQHGLRPHERPDEPFGAGWHSNIVASARWEYTSASSDGSNISNVYLTDENGNDYHFLYDGSNFVPYPTGKHEKNPYEAALAQGGNDTLILTKKFGTTVTYEHANLDSTYGDIPTDRMVSNGQDYSYVYFRASTVTGRGGVGNLTYAYPVDNTLVPETITGTGGSNTSTAGNQTIYISQDQYGHVTDVWDSDSNKTHYTYSTSLADPSDSSNVTTLTEVTDAMSRNVSYGYGNIISETDDTPVPTGTSVGTYYHLNIANVTDQNSNTYQFTYNKHSEYGYNGATVGFQSYSSYGGGNYYNTPGRSLVVSSVTPPLGNVTHFYNNSFVELQGGNGTSGNMGVLTGNSNRETLVEDADGRLTDYKWGGAQVMMQDIPSVVAAQSPNSLGETVAWGSLVITSNLGNESFTFDPSAGMALANATDFSIRTSSYLHTDFWSAPQSYQDDLPGIYDTTGNSSFGFYDDPTLQTTAAGTKSFCYNGQRLMQDIVDENSHLTHYCFDSGNLGLRTAEMHYDGNTINSTLVAETDYAYGNTTFPGVVTKKTIVHIAGASDPDWSANIGEGGNLTVAYGLDTHGRVANSTVDPDGLALKTSYTYSAAGDKLSETDPNGHTSYFTYDGRHRLTSVEYQDNSAGSSSGFATRSYGYDARGNPTSMTDENGHATYTRYDALNRVSAVIRDMAGSLVPGNDTAPLVTFYTYNNTGARLTVTPPNGCTLSSGNIADPTNTTITTNASCNTTYHYDELNRLTEMDSPSVSVNGGNTTSLITYYYYDGTNPGGSVFDSSSFKPTTTVDPRGFTTNVTYDALYRPVATSVQYDDDDAALTTRDYNSVGNLKAVHVFLNGNATGNLSADAVETTSFDYDALNRLRKTTFADNTTTCVDYTSTGFAYRNRDELDRMTETQFDAAGRTTKVIFPDSSYISTQYDNNGNAAAVTDQRGNTWNYLYDSRNRRVATIAPSVQVWAPTGGDGESADQGYFTSPTTVTTYDAVGNPTSVTDARGNTTTTVYDGANRPTYTFTPLVPYLSGNSSGNTSLVTARQYDRNGNVLTVMQGSASSQSTTDVAFSRNTMTNTYDALNRLITTKDAVNDTLSYEYDEAGNKVQVADTRGVVYSNFTYDGLNRPLTVPGSTDPLGDADDYNTHYTYDAVNKLSRTNQGPISIGYTRETDYTYDQRNRLTGVDYVGAANATLTPTMPVSLNYTYDAAGELLAVQETLAGGGNTANVAYSYDSMGRVILEAQGVAINGTVTADGTNLPNNVTGGFVSQYGYDGAGNRITALYGYLTPTTSRSDHRTVYSTFDNLNRVERIYDDEDRGTIYQYDAGGNVVDLWQPDNGFIETVFDALGRKIQITGYAPSTSTWWPAYYTYALAYDSYNNLAQQAETYPVHGPLMPRTVNLGYDNADRLTSENITTNTTTGNTSVITTVSTALAYDASNNLISKYQTETTGNTTTFLANITLNYWGNANTPRQVYYNDSSGNVTAWEDSMLPTADGCVAELSYYSLALGALSSFYVIAPTTNITYDYEDRPILITTSNIDPSVQPLNEGFGPTGYAYLYGSYNYTYDYRGRRVQREENSASDETPALSGNNYFSFHWTDLDSAITEIFSGGTPIRDYSTSANNSTSGSSNPTIVTATPWAPANTSLAPSVEFIRGSDLGGGVGGILYSLHDDSPSFYHYDGRGDVVAQTTGNLGNLTYQAAYTEDGGHNPNAPALSESGENLPAYGAQEWTASGANVERFHSNTKEQDPTGWIEEGQRLRVPGLGGFLTPDPLGVFGPDGTNLYAYVRQNPWTKFDPEGLMTESGYDNDEALAQKQARANEQNDWRAYQRGDYGDPNSQTAKDKFNTLSQEEEANRDQRIADDKAGKANIEATAKWGREHGMAVNEGALDDDPGHSSSMGPSLEKILDVPENGMPSAGQSQYAALRGQMTAADVHEVGKQAAIMLAAGIVGKAVQGVGAAVNASKYIDVTAAGARLTNIATDVGAADFQSNLVSNGFKVIKQVAGSNGPVTILSDGKTTYTIYTATSTGAASAQVTDAAGQALIKIRLGSP